MLSELESNVLNKIGRPAVWSDDSVMQDKFRDVCADVADRHERVSCTRERRGQRCWNCRPLLLVARTQVARHYATFLRRPEGAQ